MEVAAAGSGGRAVSRDGATTEDLATQQPDAEETPADGTTTEEATTDEVATDEVAEPPAPPAAEPAGAWDGRGRVVRLVVVAVVLGLLLGAAGLLVPRWQATGGEAAARAAAVEAANQFVVDINTYDSADVEEYQSRMRPQLTRGGARDFDALTSGLFPSLEGQQLVSRDAQVVGSAVDTLDGDSASVLVAANATVVRGDQSPGEYPTRWRIDLRRGGEGWTVASWEVIGSRSNSGQPAVPGQVSPSASPGASPSAGADR